jgi:hypothetical protein
MKTATASLSSAHTLSVLENNKRGANHLFNPQFNLILFFQRSMTLERGTEKGERESRGFRSNEGKRRARSDDSVSEHNE